ncbi:MAG: PaaX family transcriptional regulator C-terminal domain-containing protein [Conexibacter sp.]
MSAPLVDDQLRRRSVGAPAARSVLLTVLGEYMVPAGEEVWQETLVAALESLGHRTQAARQALARSVTASWLRTERRGRRSRMRLSEETAGMLRSGATRIYSFGSPWTWDERWLLVALRVPEERRDVRHQARTQLAWQGFGSLGGGLWISPHLERESELPRIVDGSIAELTTFHAEIGSLGDPARVIAQAWDLAALAAAYDAFLTRFSRLRPSRPEAIFRAQTELVHAWRKFPFLDPDIPEALLPPRWPRSRAHALFHERHALWHERAQQHFRTLEQAADANAHSPARPS